METHKAFTTCASQYSWTTVIENPSNVKEMEPNSSSAGSKHTKIWSRSTQCITADFW